jgi:phospholipid transport system transporter-binding protein
VQDFSRNAPASAAPFAVNDSPQALSPPGIEFRYSHSESLCEAPVMSVALPDLPGRPLVLTSPTIRTINSLQAQLAERLDESGNVQIDGSAVDRIDTAGLQLLAAFVRDLQAEARSVEWVGCSVALRRAANALGVAVALGLGSDKT